MTPSRAAVPRARSPAARSGSRPRAPGAAHRARSSAVRSRRIVSVVTPKCPASSATSTRPSRRARPTIACCRSSAYIRPPVVARMSPFYARLCWFVKARIRRPGPGGGWLAWPAVAPDGTRPPPVSSSTPGVAVPAVLPRRALRALLCLALIVPLVAWLPPDEAAAATAERIAGASRVDTAVAISRAAFPDGAPTAYLARADVFADALAAGALTDGPILLVPSCRRRAARGGRGARAPRPRDGRGAGRGSRGLRGAARAGRRRARGREAGGPDAVDTAAAVALAAAGAGSPDTVYLANAGDSPDAVAAGSLTDGPVLLVVPGAPLADAVRAVIATLDPARVVALGVRRRSPTRSWPRPQTGAPPGVSPARAAWRPRSPSRVPPSRARRPPRTSRAPMCSPTRSPPAR